VEFYLFLWLGFQRDLLAMSQLDTGVRSPSLINRFSGYAFLALITSEVALLWVFAYVPSQGGPSHLHNASVLANYNREFIYREYYRLTPFQPAGNMLTQFMLAGLLKFTGLLLAKKLPGSRQDMAV
jgi:hypothetical protein